MFRTNKDSTVQDEQRIRFFNWIQGVGSGKEKPNVVQTASNSFMEVINAIPAASWVAVFWSSEVAASLLVRAKLNTGVRRGSTAYCEMPAKETDIALKILIPSATVFPLAPPLLLEVNEKIPQRWHREKWDSLHWEFSLSTIKAA